ncbi:MAG: glycosyltransferase [Oscillospiraceae bacterium]|nr:glycosyltransferase [Oscillospiraceae bacterium]
MVSFVILHYMSFDITQQCVDLLLKNFSSEKISVVIVDNASPNRTGKKLEEYYKEEQRCKVIINDKNYGFATANNIGYSFVKKNFKPDFIVVMNNDVFISDPDFIVKLYDIYSKSNFYLLGPDILSKKTQMHQNPLRKQNYTSKELDDHIKKLNFILKFPLAFFIREQVKYCLNSYFDRLKNESENFSNYNNPVLHGACIIYSKKYIEVEEEAFCIGTFMYGEEYLLHNKCMRKNYKKIIYDTSLKVTHLDGFSTDLIHKSKFSILNVAEYKKFVFLKENMLKSRILLKNLMNDDMTGEKKND